MSRPCLPCSPAAWSARSRPVFLSFSRSSPPAPAAALELEPLEALPPAAALPPAVEPDVLLDEDGESDDMLPPAALGLVVPEALPVPEDWLVCAS